MHNLPLLTPASPTGAADCQPEVKAATASLYFVQNKAKAGNFIWGEVSTAGHLSFHVRNEPKFTPQTGCWGQWLFRIMWEHFAQQGTAITAIEGNWTEGDNLATVNRLTVNRQMPLLDAAKQTWTGQRAKERNYLQVRAAAPAQGQPGSYTEVYVLFTL